MELLLPILISLGLVITRRDKYIVLTYTIAIALTVGIGYSRSNHIDVTFPRPSVERR